MQTAATQRSSSAGRARVGPVRLPRPGVVYALARRDWLVSRSYRIAFLLDLLFGVLSLLIYFFISRTFGDETTRDLAGADTYFDFAAVGVALAVVIQASSVRLAQRVREEQLTGALEILIAQPITALELALGMAGFHFLFAVVRAVAYLFVAGSLLGADFSQADWGGFFVVLAAAGVALIPIGVLLGGTVLVLRRAETPAAFVMLGLSLLGGAYFPISVLPGWLQPLAEVLPTTFAFEGVRAALYRGEGWPLPALKLLAFGLIALPVTVVLFRGALDGARRRGSLSTP